MQWTHPPQGLVRQRVPGANGSGTHSQSLQRSFHILPLFWVLKTLVHRELEVLEPLFKGLAVVWNRQRRSRWKIYDEKHKTYDLGYSAVTFIQSDSQLSRLRRGPSSPGAMLFKVKGFAQQLHWSYCGCTGVWTTKTSRFLSKHLSNSDIYPHSVSTCASSPLMALRKPLSTCSFFWLMRSWVRRTLSFSRAPSAVRACSACGLATLSMRLTSLQQGVGLLGFWVQTLRQLLQRQGPILLQCF